MKALHELDEWREQLFGREALTRGLSRAQERFPKSPSFRQVDAENEIAFSKKDETIQGSQGILSPLRLPVPPRPRL